MADDIISHWAKEWIDEPLTWRLRDLPNLSVVQGGDGVVITSHEAADTIEHLDAIIARFLADIKQLRAALTLAVGELSTHTQYAIYSPDQLLEQFMQEAHHG